MKKFLFSIESIRAIAIFIIVFQHSLSYFNGHNISGSMAFHFIGNMSYNSTLYLVLTAGYLFQYLSPKFNQTKYFKTKLKNIISPYIFVTLLTIVTLSELDFKNIIPTTYDGSPVFRFILLHLLKGTAVYQLWFIPFIVIVFLLSPLLIKLSRINLNIIGLISFIWILLFRRPEDIYNLPANVVYFTPAYILGMALCQKQRQIDALENYNLIILVIVALMAIAYNSLAIFSDIQFIPHGFWSNSFEKVIFFIVIINIFAKLENSLNVIIKHIIQWLAKISFTVYFVHTLILIKLTNYFHKVAFFDRMLNTHHGWTAVILAVVLCCFTIFCCGIIRAVIHSIFRKKSRMLIGS